jgi:hypothetical protein
LTVPPWLPSCGGVARREVINQRERRLLIAVGPTTTTTTTEADVHSRHRTFETLAAARLGSLGHAVRQMLLLASLGALLSGSVRRVARTPPRRLTSRPEPATVRLQTWEGEGGRVDP